MDPGSLATVLGDLDSVDAGALAVDGRPALQDLMLRYLVAGGRFLVCPLCFSARQLDPAEIAANAELGETVQLCEWTGDKQVVTFSY